MPSNSKIKYGSSRLPWVFSSITMQWQELRNKELPIPILLLLWDRLKALCPCTVKLSRSRSARRQARPQLNKTLTLTFTGMRLLSRPELPRKYLPTRQSCSPSTTLAQPRRGKSEYQFLTMIWKSLTGQIRQFLGMLSVQMHTIRQAVNCLLFLISLRVGNTYLKIVSDSKTPSAKVVKLK